MRAILLPLLIACTAAPVLAAPPQDGHSRSMPMQPGSRERPDNWNHDGAPQPPRMWKGHGDWAEHYKACKKHYRSYNYRTDTYMSRGKRMRCQL
ncbi:BA14K family protein [Rhizorhapis sp. SPR117]|uniref:BA14K family protein n=1 Tax=Rhizorhapis sp. SPR117 TaxID=2912611 RepID=UPI001F376B6A|nr:BA14K family protein [Rhizorhapis sp. SPR117]